MPKFEVLDQPQQAPLVSISKKFINIGDHHFKCVELMKQNDANQCGVCSVANLFSLLGLQNIDSPEVFMTEARSSLNINGVAWLTSSNVKDLLEKISEELGLKMSVIGGYGKNMPIDMDQDEVSKIKTKTSEMIDSDTYKGFIVNRNSHYIALVKDEKGWVLSDSLSDTLDRISPDEVKSILFHSIEYSGIKSGFEIKSFSLGPS